MQIQSVVKDRMTVSRSAKVTQKAKGKPTFKSMDATLSVKNKDKETSISKRYFFFSILLLITFRLRKTIAIHTTLMTVLIVFFFI